MMLRRLADRLSSRKALSYIGASKNMLYYKGSGQKEISAA